MMECHFQQVFNTLLVINILLAKALSPGHYINKKQTGYLYPAQNQYIHAMDHFLTDI